MSEIFGNIAHKNYALTNLQLPITGYHVISFLNLSSQFFVNITLIQCFIENIQKWITFLLSCL